jgi:hypothetical protein
LGLVLDENLEANAELQLLRIAGWCRLEVVDGGSLGLADQFVDLSFESVDDVVVQGNLLGEVEFVLQGVAHQVVEGDLRLNLGELAGWSSAKSGGLDNVVLKLGSKSGGLSTLRLEVLIVQVGVGSTGLDETLDLVFNAELVGGERSFELVESGDEVEFDGLAALEGVESLTDMLHDKGFSASEDLVFKVADEVVEVSKSVLDQTLRNCGGKSVLSKLVHHVVHQVLAGRDFSGQFVAFVLKLGSVSLSILEGEMVFGTGWASLELWHSLVKVLQAVLEVSQVLAEGLELPLQQSAD